MIPHLFDPESLTLAVNWSALQPTIPPPAPHDRNDTAAISINNKNLREMIALTFHKSKKGGRYVRQHTSSSGAHTQKYS